MNSPGFMKVVRSFRGAMLRYMPFMITCRQFEDFLIDYLEGDLPPRQVFVFETHIKMCPECRAYLKAYKRASEVLAQSIKVSAKDDLPPVPDDLIKAVLAAREVKS